MSRLAAASSSRVRGRKACAQRPSPQWTTKLARTTTCLSALLMAACATVSVPEVASTGEAAAGGAPIDAWARVLDRYVDARGLVDFPALAAQPGDLYRYVSYVAKLDPTSPEGGLDTPAERLAHYINAYNALAMYGVVDLGLPATNAGLRKVRFFFLRRYRIGGEVQSLNAYETGIRALGEERIHFALNCMSVSCPRLRREPFEPETLDRVLQESAVEFFSSPMHLVVDDATRTVRVSSILSFYTGDFLAKSPTLIDYINRYRTQPIPADYRVEFLDYDWTINSSTPLR